ncbi:MAG: glycosyltransferase family 2 protein [Candidatus Sericytochromatia bacterium]
MKTAIVIVNWNTQALTLACLAAVAAHAPGREVWLVDNASSDDSVEAVEAAFPDVRLIRNAENVGFARANNQAIAESQAPYVWLLNSDTELAPGALDALEAYLDAHPRVAAVGSALVNPDGSPQACSFAFSTPLATWAEWLYLPGPLARWRDRAFGLGPRRERGRTDWVLGASMLVRRSAIEAVGTLDPGYFMYSEEMDWCRRFADAGWEVHLETQSVVMHHGGGSTRRMPDKMLIELFKSRARYFRRHLPWARRAAYAPLLALGAAWNSMYVLAGRVPGARVGTQWAIARTGFRA